MAEHKRHQGHRQRMRERVQNYGLDSLADHEVLEYILYTTNAQRDTNDIAYNLLERFGDFASVLEASEEELCTVEGVGPASARLLHMLPQVSRFYGRSRLDEKRCYKTTEQLGSYLTAKFAWTDHERALLVSLSPRHHIKAAVWLREGTSRPDQSGRQGCGVRSHQGRHRYGGACPQSPQWCGTAVHGGHGSHRQHCPGAGAGQHPSAGPFYPDRQRVPFYAGREPSAHLRFPHGNAVLAIKQKSVYIIKLLCYNQTIKYN